MSRTERSASPSTSSKPSSKPRAEPDDLVARLGALGVGRIRSVRFKRNRTRLLSVSRDGETLHLHECFRTGDDEVIVAIATILRGPRGSAAHRAAQALLRERASVWWADQPEGRLSAPRPPRPSRCCATPAQRAFLAREYATLNAAHFGNRLPADLPLRLSDRMTRRLGHMRYHREADGTRRVIELAFNRELFRPGDEAVLRDTLLHEMAHVEAWLEHGHAGHGAIWKRIAKRVGAVPRAVAPAARRS